MNDFRKLLGLGDRSLGKTLQASPKVTGAYDLYFAGDRPGAEERFQRLLRENPRDADALAGLAICVAETTGRYVSATKMAAESVRLAPEQPGGYYALAYIHLLGSKLEQGYRYLMKAKKLAPDDPRLQAGYALYDKERPPVIADLPPVHPVNVLLGQARAFGRTARQKAMLGVLVLESLVLTSRLIFH